MSRLEVMAALDARLYHNPLRGNLDTLDSGSVVRTRVLSRLQRFFGSGEAQWIAAFELEREQLVLLAKRGMMQNKCNLLLMASPNAIGVIWDPPTLFQNNQSRRLRSLVRRHGAMRIPVPRSWFVLLRRASLGLLY